ncbi:U32 family peptidase [Paenibacillus helianthi]|uniref:U32 family peptidase n=2 Tax=Paenibacillus TaxID=44249 RepID=UPI000AB9FA4B|nr:U32 family peptidase [Paenibacillus helianthi]
MEAKEKISFAPVQPYLTASVTTKEQYDACVSCGIKEIYFDNVVRRNQNDYQEKEGQLLIGGYGGIHHYRGTNPFVTDYSLNVINATSCYELYKLGAKRVTLSYEMNKSQIEDVLIAYVEANDGYPALEMIVYGKAPLMFTKYCPMRKMNQCRICRTKSYELKDEQGTFPILSHEDCTATILNGKTLNLLDELPNIKGIEALRLNFTVESKEQVVKVIHMATENGCFVEGAISLLISVTRVRVKGMWVLPFFIYHIVRSTKQLNRAAGLLHSDLTRDSWRVGWTMSVWENKDRMLEYRNHGNHAKAMRIARRIGDEVEAVHWDADTIPSWEEAKIRLHQKYGRKLDQNKW